MKGTILALFVAAVAAQSSAGSSTTTALTPEQSCLNSCAPSDVNCQAICVGVPHPGDAQMGLVTDCVGKCDQGDGSAAASEAYSKCRDACLASYIITSGTAAPGGAYTTAAIPGVSTTAAANSASVSAASAGSSGQFTTATFLIPVDYEIADLYRPRWETLTLEVHPYPTQVLRRLNRCKDCPYDTVTLSYGEAFSYLPTPAPYLPTCVPAETPKSWTKPSMPVLPSPIKGKPIDPPSESGKPTGPPSYSDKPTGTPSERGKPIGPPASTGKPSSVVAAPSGKPTGSWSASASWPRGSSTAPLRPHNTTSITMTSLSTVLRGPVTDAQAPRPKEDGMIHNAAPTVGTGSRSAASAASASGSAASKSGSAAASSSTAKSSSAAAGKVTAQIGGVAGLMLGALAML